MMIYTFHFLESKIGCDLDIRKSDQIVIPSLIKSNTQFLSNMAQITPHALTYYVTESVEARVYHQPKKFAQVLPFQNP